MDLTKIILRPSSVSLRLLQRLTGINTEDIMADLPEVSYSVDKISSMRNFLTNETHLAQEEYVRLSDLHSSYVDWCRKQQLNRKLIATNREMAAHLRSTGYSLQKIGGTIRVLDLAMGGAQ